MEVHIKTMDADTGKLTFDAVSQKVIDIPTYVQKLQKTGLFASLDYTGYTYQSQEKTYSLALSCILKSDETETEIETGGAEKFEIRAGVKAGRHRSFKGAGVRSDHFFTFRFLILPGVGKHQDLDLEKTQVEEQQMEMQQMIDSRPFIEEKIIKQQSELKELSKGYYDLMENQQVDELVTGIILKHNLFPVNLSISETTPGIPMSYILASAKASETHVLTAEEELNGETEVETDGDGTDSGFYAAPQFDYTNTTMVSVTVQGSESEIKSFLDDLARNYPGIQARSFELSNTIYVSENLKSVQSMNCRCDLAVYTCGEIGGESLIEDES